LKFPDDVGQAFVSAALNVLYVIKTASCQIFREKADIRSNSSHKKRFKNIERTIIKSWRNFDGLFYKSLNKPLIGAIPFPL
jgi:hypothetical protein